MMLETFGYMSWKGAQEGARGEFLRWFPPCSLKALCDASPVHFGIRSGISFDMVITNQNTLWE